MSEWNTSLRGRASADTAQLDGTAGTALPVVQGEMEFIRRYHGAIAEVFVLGSGFVITLAVIWGGLALFATPS